MDFKEPPGWYQVPDGSKLRVQTNITYWLCPADGVNSWHLRSLPDICQRKGCYSGGEGAAFNASLLAASSCDCWTRLLFVASFTVKMVFDQQHCPTELCPFKGELSIFRRFAKSSKQHLISVDFVVDGEDFSFWWFTQSSFNCANWQLPKHSTRVVVLWLWWVLTEGRPSLFSFIPLTGKNKNNRH